ncbi:MAG: hypothetical protein JWQ91_3163 [Aeromicrobium sp.]|nr:hypothetical protein [Aeromicrobium sp.]
MVSRGVLVVIQRVSIFQRADNSYNGEHRRNCTMLILTRALDQGVTARNATPRQFFLSHARGYKLDREIAAGAAPESSPLRALRAQILVRPSFRRTLARRVEQLLEEAGPPPRVAGCRMAPWSTRILEAAGALQMLIDRLQAPAPVPARGVAGVRVLLIDGAGPLYYPGANDHLGLVVLEIVEQLEPLTNW